MQVSLWLTARSFQCVGITCHSKSAPLHDTFEEGNLKMLKKRPWIQANSLKTKAKRRGSSGFFFVIDFNPVTLTFDICNSIALNQ